jgi:integrase
MPYSSATYASSLSAAQTEIQNFIKENRPPATSKTYQSQQGRYESHCTAQNWEPYPADLHAFVIQVCNFIQSLATKLAFSSIRVATAACCNEYSLRTGAKDVMANPWIAQTLKAAAIATPNKSSRQKLPIRRDLLESILNSCDAEIDLRKAAPTSFATKALSEKGIPNFLKPMRDAALFASLYYASLRASEAAALRWKDIERIKLGPSEEVLEISIVRSKTNPAALSSKARKVIIKQQRDPMQPLNPSAYTKSCPFARILLLKCYLGSAATPDSPVFPSLEAELSTPLSTNTINKLTQAAIAKVGGNPSKYGSHSFRAGSITDAATKGANLDDLRAHGGWAPNSSTLQTHYIRPETNEKLAVATTLTLESKSK